MNHAIRGASVGILWAIVMYCIGAGSLVGAILGGIFLSILMSLFLQWLDLREEKRAENEGTEVQD